jgi:hypothetical protein
MQFKIFAKINFSAILLFLLFIVFSNGYTQTFKDTVNAYFALIRKDFERICKNPILANTPVTPANRLFVKALKRNQPIISFSRINSKGIIVNEVIRGEIPPKKVNRKLEDQKWFAEIKNTKNEYSEITEEKGRYYLIWNKPLLDKKKRLLFIVTAKIDIWDCFHAISKKTTSPFLARIEQKSLYSHKWKDITKYQIDTLNIYGTNQITILTEKQDTSALARESLDISVKKVTSVASQEQKQPEQKTSLEAKKTKDKKSKNKVLIIIIGIVIALIIIFLLFRFYIWLNNKFMINSINKSE